MAPYERGDVVWHPASFRDGGRPYVVLSDDEHPFYGEEYVVVGVTTTERERAVELGPDRWAEGGTSKRSWASPWFVLIFNQSNVTNLIGRHTIGAKKRITAEHFRSVGGEVS